MKVSTEGGNIVLDCAGGEPFGPAEADLGTLNPDGSGNPLGWDEPPTEYPEVGAIEVWELHNFTADAHPIHIHEITFEVVEPPAVRRRPPSPGELGARSQGHRDRLPRRNHAREGALRPRRPLRLALPHRRARGQRDDAALPDRTLTRLRPTRSSRRYARRSDKRLETVAEPPGDGARRPRATGPASAQARRGDRSPVRGYGDLSPALGRTPDAPAFACVASVSRVGRPTTGKDDKRKPAEDFRALLHCARSDRGGSRRETVPLEGSSVARRDISGAGFGRPICSQVVRGSYLRPQRSRQRRGPAVTCSGAAKRDLPGLRSD